MVRSSLSASAATAILDVKPNGEVEFMSRLLDGEPMEYIAGATVTLPAWLRLQTSRDGVSAWTSQDGITWTPVKQNVAMVPAGQFEYGVAVTSHDAGQLNTAHISHLTLDVTQSSWTLTDVGDVGALGSVGGSLGAWSLMGAGSDIWGTADSFLYFYRHSIGNDQHLRVRVDSLENTNPFAKTGLMLRDSLDPDSPAVIVDVKPDGGIEFMQRRTAGSSMEYIGGATVAFPAWLDLSWQTIAGSNMANVTAFVSQDGITWSPVPGTAGIPLTNTTYEVGVAVTSHDATRRATATIRGLSLTPIDAASDDIGHTGLVGNATTNITQCCDAAIVQGSGADIWGTSDSFQFAHGPALTDTDDRATFRVMSLEASHPFAKAGLMARDTLDANAAHVVLDVRPGGDVEFMARKCTGCDTTFLGTAHVSFPAVLRMTRHGNTYEAFVLSNGPAQSLGTVDVPMAQPIAGYAVTSHDTANIATAVFDVPPTP